MFEKRKDSPPEGPNAHFEAGLSDLSASRSAQTSGRAAVIGPRIRINGDISGDENLVVEGQVKGKVKLSDHRVDIGSSGRVHADIDAKVVKIEGEVRGDITGHEKVIISSSGNVQGNIVAPRMTLEDGAKFKGSIDMDPGDTPTREPKAEPKPAPRVEAKPAPKADPKPPPKAEVKPGGNGQGQMPPKSSAEPNLELKGG